MIRATNTSSIHNLSVWRWNSPTPYLFSSLVLMLGLIAMALLFLACSYQKRMSTSTSDGEGIEMPVKWTVTELNPTPEIVVIMAGDDKPTYLAAPAVAAPSNQMCQCGTQA